jgi:hypothetical protein
MQLVTYLVHLAMENSHGLQDSVVRPNHYKLVRARYAFRRLTCGRPEAVIFGGELFMVRIQTSLTKRGLWKVWIASVNTRVCKPECKSMAVEVIGTVEFHKIHALSTIAFVAEMLSSAILYC